MVLTRCAETPKEISFNYFKATIYFTNFNVCISNVAN